MPMFGSSAPSSSSALPYDPGQLSPQDRMMMAGAMLRDVGGSLNGGDAQNVMALRNMLAQRQMMNGVLGSLYGQDGSAAPPTPMPLQPGAGAQPGAMPGGMPGGAPPAAPVAPAAPPRATAGATINPRALAALALFNPQAARAIAEAQKLTGETMIGPNGEIIRKYDPSNVGRVLPNPQSVNNTIVNMNDPRNVNRVIPSAPVPGAMPVYNNRGEVVDWNLPQGAQQAIIAAQAPTIQHNRAMEQIGAYEAGTGRISAGTGAAAQRNTASQNTAALPPGFIPRPRKR